MSPKLTIDGAAVYSEFIPARTGYTLVDYEVFAIKVSAESEGDIEDETATSVLSSSQAMA